MAQINDHYRKLRAGYLFPEIGRRVRAFQEANPGARLIRLGIGDVTLPLAPAVVEAMRRAVEEMGTAAGFRGYPPDQGEPFLIDAIRALRLRRARGGDRRRRDLRLRRQQAGQREHPGDLRPRVRASR